MTYNEKLSAVKARAPWTRISGDKLTRVYYYGENPYADMLIENALLCDMFPKEVPDAESFFGFRRSAYSVICAQ